MIKNCSTHLYNNSDPNIRKNSEILVAVNDYQKNQYYQTVYFNFGVFKFNISQCVTLCDKVRVLNNGSYNCQQEYDFLCHGSNGKSSLKIKCDGKYRGDPQHEQCKGSYTFGYRDQQYIISDGCNDVLGGTFIYQNNDFMTVEEICQNQSNLEIWNLQTIDSFSQQV
eukprot:TRINITY_DN2108_c0_g1_i2.p3 TRINITY_DN2108_c0_g1~~TRINITY_DN2108_c0_g1_i2.p3  ORF type:complete len:167 (+),score=1.23 TRINITY_DN2108_c0_g1_i2:423-923(+)